MNTTNSFKNNRIGSDKARTCARPARRQRFSTEEDGRVEYFEFLLRFVMLTCLLCTLAICLVRITTPASVPADVAGTADAGSASGKTTPAVIVRVTLPGGFHF